MSKYVVMRKYFITEFILFFTVFIGGCVLFGYLGYLAYIEKSFSIYALENGALLYLWIFICYWLVKDEQFYKDYKVVLANEKKGGVCHV